MAKGKARSIWQGQRWPYSQDELLAVRASKGKARGEGPSSPWQTEWAACSPTVQKHNSGCKQVVPPRELGQLLPMAMQCVLTLMPMDTHGLCWQRLVCAVSMEYVSLGQGAEFLSCPAHLEVLEERAPFPPTQKPCLKSFLLSPLLILLALLGGGLGRAGVTRAPGQPEARHKPTVVLMSERQKSVFWGGVGDCEMPAWLPFPLSHKTLIVFEIFCPSFFLLSAGAGWSSSSHIVP